MGMVWLVSSDKLKESLVTLLLLHAKQFKTLIKQTPASKNL